MNYNIRDNYNTIAEEFCNYYYTNYDESFLDLAHLYTIDTCINFMGEEVLGFNNYYNLLVNNYNINNIEHKLSSFYAMPLGNNTLMIEVFGEIIVNNSIPDKFIDTFLIQYDHKSNGFFICGNIFTTI